MLAFETPKLLYLKAKGSGGIEEIVKQLDGKSTFKELMLKKIKIPFILEKDVSFFLVRLPDRSKELVQNRADGKMSTVPQIFEIWL